MVQFVQNFYCKICGWDWYKIYIYYILYYKIYIYIGVQDPHSLVHILCISSRTFQDDHIIENIYSSRQPVNIDLFQISKFGGKYLLFELIFLKQCLMGTPSLVSCLLITDHIIDLLQHWVVTLLSRCISLYTSRYTIVI